MNEATSPQPGSNSPADVGSPVKTTGMWPAFRKRWKRIILTVLLLAVSLSGVAYFLRKPTYTSEAWLLIKERPEVVLKSLDLDSKQFVPTQLEIIRSPRLLAPLAQKAAILATPELQHEPDVALALGKRIVITQRGKSDIYVVSFSSVSPTQAELIVKEVTAAYLAFHRQNESEKDSRIIRLLEEQRSARYEEMKQLRENLRALALQLTGIDPFGDHTRANDLSSSAQLLPRLQDKVIEYEVEREFLEAQIKAAEELQARAKPTSDSQQPNADKLTALKQEHAAIIARLAIVKEKFQMTVGSVQKYTGATLELEFLRAKFQQVTQIHDEISARILAIVTEQRAPTRVELFKEATLPSQADGW